MQSFEGCPAPRRAAYVRRVWQTLETLDRLSAKRPAPASDPPPGKDVGPAERWRHGDRFREITPPGDHAAARAGVRVRRVETQRTLDRYLRRRQITDRQWDAGDRLYRQWRAAGREARLTGPYEPPVDHSRAPERVPSGTAYRRALDKVGPRFNGVLLAVCLCDESAGTWAQRRGRSRDAGMMALQDALDALADAYGMP